MKRRSKSKKSEQLNKILFWLPRALSILFIVFISIFALDVFGQGYSFLETIIALFMHLLPSIILGAALAIAWKFELVGGIIFLFLGIGYTISTIGKAHWSVYLFIPLPLFVIGILFLTNKFIRHQMEK